MKRGINIWWKATFILTLEFLLAVSPAYPIEIKEEPCDGLPAPELFQFKNENLIFLTISPDGKHTIGHLFPEKLLVDGKLQPYKDNAEPSGMQLFSNPWDDRMLLRYSRRIENSFLFDLVWNWKGDVWKIDAVQKHSLWVGEKCFLKDISSKKYHVLDFWLEPIPEQNKTIPMAVLEKPDGKCVQYLDSETVQNLGPEQTHWCRTFVSPSGEQTVRLHTDMNGKQSLTWVDEDKIIIQDCDAIHGICWLSEVLNFEVYRADLKENKVFRWSKGVWDASESWPEFSVRVSETPNTFQIQHNSHPYGPFTNAHSRVYSLHAKHLSVLVQLADNQRWGILTDEGLADVFYDRILPIKTISSTRFEVGIVTNHWYTFGFRDGKWYRLDISWD